MKSALILSAVATCLHTVVLGDDHPLPEVVPLGSNLEKFDYPWPVQFMKVDIGNTKGEMAYMDVSPESPNGKTVMLLHGKNFCGATWEHTAQTLLDAGYRTLIPDQVGFCKSSKPLDAQYTFGMLAHFSHNLMNHTGVKQVVLLAHSTGGFLGMHFSVMFPDAVERLVLVNPLGLTDRMAEGVPYVPLSKLIAGEKKKTAAKMKAYQLHTYYHGNWEPRYDKWIAMLAGQYATEDDDKVEIAQAKLSEMILTQPVSHRFADIQAPVTLLIGALDTTTFGKPFAVSKVRESLRAIPAVAPEAARQMPNAELIRFEGLGHSPQVEAPEVFEAKLLEVLARPVDGHRRLAAESPNSVLV